MRLEPIVDGFIIGGFIGYTFSGWYFLLVLALYLVITHIIRTIDYRHGATA